MTYTTTSPTSSVVGFVSTSATQQTVDFAGKTAPMVTFNGAGGSWILSSAINTAATSTVTVTAGTLNTNNQACSWGLFNSSNSNTRVVTLGSSIITLTGNNSWTTQTTTGLTFNAGSSTLNFTGNGGNTLQLGSLSYNIVNLTGSGNVTLGGAPSFVDFNRTGTAAKTDSLTIVTMTVTGNLTIAGNSAINRMLVQSNGMGVSRTITAANVSVSNADFMDINGAGAGSWNLSAITGGSGDCGGNTNITFTPASTQSWQFTSGGNWSSVGSWTSRIPLPQDNVVINKAFAASQVISADMPRLGTDINFTGSTGTPDWRFNGGLVTVYGSITLISGMVLSSTGGMNLLGRGTHTLKSAGNTYLQAFIMDSVGGTYTLLDDFATSNSSTFSMNRGALYANGFNFSTRAFTSTANNTRIVDMGTGTWYLTAAAGTPWNIGGTGLTFNGGSATISLPTATASNQTFAGGGQTYGTLTYNVAGSTGMLDITGANTFNTINFSDATNARTLRFQAGVTNTVNNWNVFGTSGNLISVVSVTGTTFTLSKPSGVVSSDYLNLVNSVATGGATWYAGANSTDGGGNTGWVFTAPPAASGTRSNLMMMGV